MLGVVENHRLPPPSLPSVSNVGVNEAFAISYVLFDRNSPAAPPTPQPETESEEKAISFCKALFIPVFS